MHNDLDQLSIDLLMNHIQTGHIAVIQIGAIDSSLTNGQITSVTNEARVPLSTTYRRLRIEGKLRAVPCVVIEFKIERPKNSNVSWDTKSDEVEIPVQFFNELTKFKMVGKTLHLEVDDCVRTAFI